MEIEDKKLYIGLALVAVLMLIVGVALVFACTQDDSETKITTTQMVVMSGPTQKTTETTKPCERITSTSKPCDQVGQTLREQNYCSPSGTTCNSVEVNIHNTAGYYKPQYPYYRHYKPYPHHKYYNGYTPYYRQPYRHGFHYSNSRGYWSNYNYY